MNKNILQNSIRKIVFPLMITATMMTSCELADDLTGVNKTVAALEGTWTCVEESEFYKTTASTYQVYLSPDPDNPNGVIIDEFYNVGLSIKATVSGDVFTIANQNAQDGYSVYGSGTITNNNGKITLNYVVDDGSGGPLDHVSAVYTKI